MQQFAGLPWTQITSGFAIIMALLVIQIRMKAATRPTSLKKIMIPPLGMSTGFLMFLFPGARISFTYAALAIAVGLLFSGPLIWTSHFEILEGEVYLKRSRAFVFILLGLLALRISLHSFVEQYISLFQTGAVFFVLAFSMILPWRIAMLIRYRKVHARLSRE